MKFHYNKSIKSRNTTSHNALDIADLPNIIVCTKAHGMKYQLFTFMNILTRIYDLLSLPGTMAGYLIIIVSLSLEKMQFRIQPKVSTEYMSFCTIIKSCKYIQ